jgi:anti-sigma factor RsiW
MTSEALERLLIDRASGDLEPDVKELLEAHLEHDPAARKEAREIEETLRLARRALADQKVVPLPQSRPSWRVPSWAWAMAACFICGLFLGIFGARERSAAPSIAFVPAPTTVAESGFWSASRFRARLSPVSVKSENRVIWKSPVRKPEIL